MQSDVILGQGVLTARPDAKDRVLYSLHFGKVPGVSGGPTNFGLDPYVATRGANGWTTRYVGLPADETPGAKPFGSPLSGSDDDLNAFAFGGTGLCSPCFPDGSTGIPVRMPDGGLVQGMKGSLDPGPGATQAGFIGQRLSDDGTHLVFGSTSKFEEGATAGDVTIYDRDLASGTTHIVSRTPAGATMTGTGNGELAISADGSRILLGKLVATDPFGVQRWHPYLNVNDSNSTIDLAPSTTTGVVFSGMSADGSTDLLRHQGQARRRRHRQQRRSLPGRRQRRKRHPDPGLDRERRRQHRCLQPGRELRKLHLEQPGRHRVL